MEDRIKYVLNGVTKYYMKEELRAYYKGVCIASKAYDEELFDSNFEILLNNLQKYDGDPYGFLPPKVRAIAHRYLARTGSFIVFYSDGDKFKTRLRLHTDECKAVSNPKDIKIDPNVKNLVQNLELKLQHSKKTLEPYLNDYTTITIPPKERFYSSANYNHVILHECAHRVGIDKGGDFLLDLLCVHAENKYEGSSRGAEEIKNDVINGKTDKLLNVEKHLAVCNAIDEIATERVACKMMEKLGIPLDKRDYADRDDFIKRNYQVMTTLDSKVKSIFSDRVIKLETMTRQLTKHSADLEKTAITKCTEIVKKEPEHIKPIQKSKDREISL